MVVNSVNKQLFLMVLYDHRPEGVTTVTNLQRQRWLQFSQASTVTTTRHHVCRKVSCGDKISP